ncbi:hypothetical protein SEA_TRAX_73 [Gordonia phage Trax]|uniref:Lipoprotein n=1 Tax=Gordonia phage Trax TaxID=2591121 RepID=A0A515MH24_9CAUD|nr:hypothetical protein L3Y20_gp073 [Gordonia phage Trax]QDM55960.1 hypothetical protein SEA_TRAX_73 [Gordonia phage Trax]
MKRVLALVVAGVAGLAVLTGCGNEPEYTGPDDYKPRTIQLRDGRTLECVQVGTGSQRMMTCDWANVK